MMNHEHKIINGKHISLQIKAELLGEVEELKEQSIVPKLVVILIGNNPASKVYVRNKELCAKELGIDSEVIRYPEAISQKELMAKIDELNKDKSVNGFFVQLPLPDHIIEKDIINAIDPEKDVDGFHPVNMGKLVYGEDSLLPATPSGIMEMLKKENIDVKGKEVVIVGRSNIVGKPMFHLMLKKHATVTVCHSRTKNLAYVTKRAEILVVAIGRARMIKREHVRDDAVIIDVGMNKVEGKLCGDVDFDDVLPVVSKITPVPRGVGPMTITMLMKNTVKATKRQHGIG